jgi:hypothetical protein
VGWSGAGHEIVPNGSVLIDGDRIKSVGIGQISICRPRDRCQPARSSVLDSSICTCTRS